MPTGDISIVAAFLAGLLSCRLRLVLPPFLVVLALSWSCAPAPTRTAARPAGSTLSILSGTAFTRASAQAPETPAADGATLPEGAVVRTGPASNALITFFDGSTIDLEDQTELTITLARPEGNATAIRVDQTGGRVWARVVALTDSRSRFEMATATAVAAVRGSLIGASYTPDGVMTCWVIEGRLFVTARGQEVALSPGQESVTPAGQPPGAPRDRPLAASLLRVRPAGPGLVRLVDPSGRAIGFAPPGIEVNQIRNALTSRPGQTPGFLDIPDPLPGAYTLVVESPEAGELQLGLSYEREGQTVAGGTISQPLAAGSRLTAPIQLTTDPARPDLTLGLLAPLTGPAPGRVIVRDSETAQRPDPGASPVPTLPTRR